MAAVDIPRFTAQDAIDLACATSTASRSLAKKLPSYIDQNFRLEHPSGRRLVLKMANAAIRRDELDFENRAMDHVARVDRELPFPRVLSTLDGQRIVSVEREGRRHYVRLLTYLKGVPWGASPTPPTPDRFRRLGSFVATLTRALESFSHPVMHRAIDWDVKRLPVLRQYLGEITDPRRRQIVTRVLDRFDHDVAPRLPWLPASVIHNDANEQNVLVDDTGREITGLIDFGDLVHTVTASEIAVTMAYAMLGQDDPFAAGAQILSGYHQGHPLGAAELDVLFDLVLGRLATSVTFAAYHSRLDPDNAYLDSQRGARLEGARGTHRSGSGHRSVSLRRNLRRDLGRWP